MMECRGSFIYAHLLSPELDDNDVRFGQLIVLLLATMLFIAFAVGSRFIGSY